MSTSNTVVAMLWKKNEANLVAANISKEDFLSLDLAAAQTIVAPEQTTTVDDVFKQQGSEAFADANAEAEVVTVSDKVFLNLRVTVNGHDIRLKSIEISNEYNTSVYKDKKIVGQHTDTVSLVNLVKAVGGKKATELCDFDISLGKTGERNEEVVDLTVPFAAADPIAVV